MKKLTAILLSLMMLICLLPASAFAEPVTTISNIKCSMPGGDTIYADETTMLTVEVCNRGERRYNASLKLVLPSEMTIESGSDSMYIGTVKANEWATATFPVICKDGISNTSYKITAILSGDVESTNYDGSTSIVAGTPQEYSIYIPVLGGTSSAEIKDVATPILMVSNYSYGGSVKAGSNFRLTVTLQNTSNVTLGNIKVNIAAGGGEFIPVGSSNAYYIKSIAPGASDTHTMTMSCNRDALQGAHSVVVSTSYEDSNKRSYTASDTISVPVVQETRLVIDDILDPGWLTMADMAYVSVNYRNMGNNQINNLVISASGDFDVEGSSSYYVGNMASGRSDYYSFQFFPRQAGECKGQVVFTYEDAAGQSHDIVKEFTFNIAEAPVWDDPGMWEDPIEVKQGLPLWAKIAIPVAAVVALVVILKVLKKRKLKKQEALDLDE